MTGKLTLLLLLVSLSGCAVMNAMYESPNPGVVPLGPREEVRFQFGNPYPASSYTDDTNSIIRQREYDREGIAGRDRALWLMGIWKF